MGDDEFYVRHDADPKAIYLVEAYLHEEDSVMMATFSTQDMAKRWIGGIREMFSGEVDCTVMPFVVDSPKWGNEGDDTFPDYQRSN